MNDDEKQLISILSERIDSLNRVTAAQQEMLVRLVTIAEAHCHLIAALQPIPAPATNAVN